MAGIFQKAIQAWLRFPLALLVAVTAAVGLIGAEWFAFHISGTKEWGHLLASWALMAFCWVVCGHLWAERLPRLWQRLLVPALVLMATAPVWWLGNIGEDNSQRWNHFILVGVMGLLFLLVLPLLTPADGRDLRTRRWLYGLAKAIVLSFLVALVVFIGLGLQLYLLEVLFNDYLRDYVFPLMILCQTIFAPWCALALAPNLWRAEETVQPPALAVKIVVQYVLGGLLVLYSVTLNVYCLYVLVSWQWPEGAIAGQVVALASVGGLIWTLVYAVRNDVPGRLERLILVGFWPGLLAPVVALFIASTLRIEQYGITEPRYYLLLGGGLTLLGGVLQLARRRVPSPSVLVVPVIATLLFTQFGPWSAETIAVSSQFQRLETTLSRVGWLGSDGKINEFSAVAATPEDRKAIENMTRFLVQRGAEERLLSLLHNPEHYAQGYAKSDYYGRTAAFMMLLPEGSAVAHHVALLPADAPLSIRGYDLMFRGELDEFGRTVSAEIPFQGEKIFLYLRDQGNLSVIKDDAEIVTFNIAPAIKRYLDESESCQGYAGTLSSPLVFDHAMEDGASLRLLVTSLTGRYVADSGNEIWLGVNKVGFVLLLKEKP